MNIGPWCYEKDANINILKPIEISINPDQIVMDEEHEIMGPGVINSLKNSVSVVDCHFNKNN